MRTNIAMLLMAFAVMCLGLLSAQDETDIQQQDAAVKQQDASVKQQDAAVKQQDAAVKQAASKQQNAASGEGEIVAVVNEVQNVKEDVRENAEKIVEVEATVEDAIANPYAQWGAMGLIMALLVYQITVREPAENRRRDAQQAGHDVYMKDMRTEFVNAMSLKDGAFAMALKEKDNLFTVAMSTKDGMFVQALKDMRDANDRAVERHRKQA